MSGLDVPTILRAIEIVGAATEAGLKLYRTFQSWMPEADRAALQRQYQDACRESDRLHDSIQSPLNR